MSKNSKIRMNGAESNSLSDKIEDKIFVCRGRNVKVCVIDVVISHNIYQYTVTRQISSCVNP